MCLTNSPTTVCQQPLDNFRGSRNKARAGIPFCVSIKAIVLSHLAQSGVIPESLPPGNNFSFLPSLRRACNLDHGPEFVAAINDRFVSLIRCLLKLATRRNLISNEHWIEWTWNGPPALEAWLRSQCSMKDHWEVPLEQMMGSLSLVSPSPPDAVLDDLAAPKQARYAPSTCMGRMPKTGSSYQRRLCPDLSSRSKPYATAAVYPNTLAPIPEPGPATSFQEAPPRTQAPPNSFGLDVTDGSADPSAAGDNTMFGNLDEAEWEGPEADWEAPEAEWEAPEAEWEAGPYWKEPAAAETDTGANLADWNLYMQNVSHLHQDVAARHAFLDSFGC
ncbi:hypothetical protein CGLO_04760 [Colletotrichum gloeosporioides Cg-14]|uniref:Uncharacterized protein n=1 Tax=Colletotrichum gloeosporioides (strain Cg-14) TaxID=1237896 RepID=T0KRN0_COLGC|nr:hypothetical protein CGLO_04760 [Colletotrichum gloeosporioides Cg-14]